MSIPPVLQPSSMVQVWRLQGLAGGQIIIISITGLVASAVSCSFATSVASARVTVFSNRGPEDTFDPVIGNIVLGEDDLSIGNVDQAVRFTTGRHGLFFPNAELAGRLVDSAHFVNVYLTSKSGGLPGRVLFTMALTNLPGPDDAGLVVAATPMQFTLMPNTTPWIAADAMGNTDIAWHRNTTGQIGGRAGRLGFPSDP